MPLSFNIYTDILNVQNGKPAQHFQLTPRPSGSPLFRLNAYEADADPAVLITFVEKVWYQYAKNMTYSKTQEWTNYFLSTNPANPYSRVAGGYKVEWGPNSELSFWTVRGSGHMVMLYFSNAASSMVEQQVYGQTKK